MVGEAACEERENSVEAGNWRERCQDPAPAFGSPGGCGWAETPDCSQSLRCRMERVWGYFGEAADDPRAEAAKWVA